MQITRNNHLRYMAKLTPFLLLAYVLQVIIYQHFAPAHLSGDMNLFLGIGLAMIIMCYQFYDHHHKIIFKENYVEVRFDVLKMKEEILYSNIVHVEIRKKRHYYAHMVLYQKDGSLCHFHHVDSPELIAEYIEKKKIKRF
jgi:hypothetical protein